MGTRLSDGGPGYRKGAGDLFGISALTFRGLRRGHR